MANPANFQQTRQTSETITANDTCKALKIHYVGSGGDPQVVFGTHDFLFYTNYTTGAVLDTYVFQAGVTAGHLETDKGAADMTAGTLAALINASPNWKCTLVGLRPEDNVYTHSGTLQHLLAVAADAAEAIKADTEDGTTIYLDSSTAPYQYSCTIGPENLDGAFASFAARVSRGNIYPGKNDVTDFEDSAGAALPGAAAASAVDWVAVLNFIEALATFTTSNTIQVYGSTQTVSRLILERAGAATTVTGTYTDAPTLVSNPGERLIVRMTLVGGSLGSTMLLSSLKVSGAIGVLVP